LIDYGLHDLDFGLVRIVDFSLQHHCGQNVCGVNTCLL